MKKLIIFDMDGVLFDSIGLADEHIKKQYPGITDEYHQEMMLGNYHEEYAKLKTLFPSPEKSDEEKLLQKQEYSDKKSRVPMYPGMKELLQKLHSEGYILALNTSAYNNNCIPLLEREGLVSLFDFLGTAEVSKNKTEKFLMIEKNYNVGNEETLFVTDTLGDVREAAKANVPTLAVTWGAHDKSFFLREKNSNLIGIADSVRELEQYITT